MELLQVIPEVVCSRPVLHLDSALIVMATISGPCRVMDVFHVSLEIVGRPKSFFMAGTLGLWARMRLCVLPIVVFSAEQNVRRERPSTSQNCNLLEFGLALES
jgi:hypothetical protein